MSKKTQILVVEDEGAIAAHIEQMLIRSGYELTSVVDLGEFAVQKARENQPDLVLMDVNLAGEMDGIEAAQHIRQNHDIPIVYLTAHSDTDLLERAKATEPLGYLLKPFQEQELQATIETALYKHNIETELKKTNRRLEQEIIERSRAEKRQKLAIQILEILNQPGEKTDIIRNILLLIKESMGFEAVGIRLKEGEDFPYYQTNGFPAAFVEAERYLCAHDQTGELIRDSTGNPCLECMCGNVICGRTNPSLPFFTEGGSFWTNSTTELLASTSEEDRQARTRNRCNAEGYESVALIPLYTNGETIGLLQLNDHRKYMFTSDMILFFEGIGASIGIALMRKRAEEALRESEERYRELFDNMSSGVAVYEAIDDGQDFIFRDFNRAGEQIENISRDDLIGQRVTKMFSGVKDLGLFDVFQRVWQTGDPAHHPISLYQDERIAGWRENYVYKLPSGEIVAVYDDITERKRTEVELEKYREHLEELVTERTVRLQQEIAERKQAEEALRENETRFRTISELVSDYVYVLRVEPEEHLVREWVTDACARITGYTPEEIDKLDGWMKVVHPDDRDIASQHRQEFLSGREHISEYRIISKSGEIYWLRDYSRPVWDTTGSQVVRVFGAVQDITARKRVEEEVLLLKNAIETAHVGVTITGTERKILYVNPAEAAMHGYTVTELMGKDARIFSPEEYWQEIEFSRLEDHWERETVNIRKDGSTFPIHSISTPVRNKDGTPAGIITVSEDITKRKRAEEELQHAKQAADAANRAKSEFLANMSHELRTPLNAIIGFSQLLSRHQDLDPEQHEYLSTINRSGEHLLTLINQVLDLSKIEAGRMTLNEQNFDLYRLLDDVEDMFRLRAEDKRLQLLCARASDVPQYVRTDEVKLRQVLINLLNNAIKFTEEGKIELRIRNEELRMKKDNFNSIPNSQFLILNFSVADTGAGIAPDELEHLFEAFTQTSAGQQTQEGTGLGLAISRKFVQLMGGDMNVRSEPGKGSTFTFDIQARRVEPSTIVNQQSISQRVIALAPNQPRYRILVVEDTWESRQLLLNLLRRPFGFELREAKNGQEALTIWKEWHPDLIWMDMRMPVMNGYEATKRIRNEELRMKNKESRNPKTPNTPLRLPLRLRSGQDSGQETPNTNYHHRPDGQFLRGGSNRVSCGRV